MGKLLWAVLGMATVKYQGREIFEWMIEKAIESTQRGIVSTKKLNKMFSID